MQEDARLCIGADVARSEGGFFLRELCNLRAARC